MFNKNKINIYQIYYNEQTKSQLDPDFLSFDNSANSRPDWREYWPVRNFLLTEDMDPDSLYGFFSPKFREKTHLSGHQVIKHIKESIVSNADTDVYLFSPWFDQAAWYENVFIQGGYTHPESNDLFAKIIALIAPGNNLNSFIMDSTNIVFCNYFVAKPRFWKRWLSVCELIFQMSEGGDAELNKMTAYDKNTPTPLKVFVIERIASLILALEKGGWKVNAYNPMSLPISKGPLFKYGMELIQLDALKIAFNATQRAEYLNIFNEIRGRVVKSMDKNES